MKSIETTLLLPNRFKKIGIGLIAAHVALILLLRFVFGLYEAPSSIPDIVFFVPISFLKYTVMVGLTMFITSKEKFEDELVNTIRLKSFQYGLYLTVFISLSLFVLSLINSTDLRVHGIDGVNALLVYISVIYQFNIYRFKSDEE